MYLLERERVRVQIRGEAEQEEGERISGFMLSSEPDLGLDLMTPR